MKQKSKKKKPIRFRQSLFWDVDPKTIDPQKHARYIIERILDFGNDREIKWAVNYYHPRRIKRVLAEPRVALHEKNLNYWSLVFK